jgi:hypothetical protein
MGVSHTHRLSLPKEVFQVLISVRNRITVLKKNWGTEHSKGNKTVPAKVATTCTEDGHKQVNAHA